MGEAELVAGFAAGEPGSVDEMYREYGRLVYAREQPGARRRRPGRGSHPADLRQGLATRGNLRPWPRP